MKKDIPRDKPTILVFVSCYLPGYKSGGPLRTIAGMVSALHKDYNFKIFTRDRDSGDSRPYTDVKIDSWQKVGEHQRVYYASARSLAPLRMSAIIREANADYLYLNSFFNFRFTILPLILRKAGLLPNIPIVLAPRGEFSPGALQIKFRKKFAFINFAKVTGLYSEVTWQATSQEELAHIQRWFGNNINYKIARDLASLSPIDTKFRRPLKQRGAISMIFLSRIVPKKNLDGALRLLKRVNCPVQFSIFGPLEDPGYWKTCQNIIAELPPRIRVEYKGEVAHEQVLKKFREHHLFFFPTHGENFGHVILESLLAGCPVLISDQTPWNDLPERQVGWTYPLASPARFVESIENIAAMSQAEFDALSERAHAYGIQAANDPTVLEQNRNLFRI